MLNVNASIKGFTHFDFSTTKVRRTMRAEGQPIKRIIKGLISSKGTSAAGEYSGRQTGLMRRSVKVKVARNGMSVAIAPFRIGRMLDTKDGFYPAYQIFGRKDGTLAKRKNPMDTAFKQRRQAAQSAIMNTLTNSIKPRTSGRRF